MLKDWDKTNQHWFLIRAWLSSLLVQYLQFQLGLLHEHLQARVRAIKAKRAAEKHEETEGDSAPTGLEAPPPDTSPAQDAAGVAAEEGHVLTKPGKGLWGSELGDDSDVLIEETKVDTPADSDLVKKPKETIDVTTPEAVDEKDRELSTRERDQMGTGSQIPSSVAATPSPAKDFWLHLLSGLGNLVAGSKWYIDLGKILFIIIYHWFPF